MKRRSLPLIVLVFLICINVQTKAQTTLPTKLCDTNLTKDNSPYVALEDIHVPEGCTVSAEPGVEILLDDTVYFTVEGKLSFSGSEALPITFKGYDGVWGNLFFYKADESLLKNVIVEDATYGPDGDSHDAEKDVAAISTYKTDLTLEKVTFKNNLKSFYARYGNIHLNNCIFDSSNTGEKVLIQFADGAITENCVFYYTFGYADAIDYDALSNGIIRNNQILGGDDDGIDIGQQNWVACNGVIIENNHIERMKDKGVSVGEGSQNIRIRKNLIINSTIGTGVKDSSYAVIENNTYDSDSLGIGAWEKNDGFGGGVTEIRNTIITNSEGSALYKDSLAVIEITYSLSNTNSLQGTGNIYDEPLFNSKAAKDYGLTENSPCIDSGDPNSMEDPDSTRADIGAFYYDQTVEEEDSVENLPEDPVELPEPSGIENETLESAFKIYPNPAEDEVIIVLPVNETDYAMDIYSLSGQKIKSVQLNDNTSKIDISKLPTGVYFIQLQKGELVINRKINKR